MKNALVEGIVAEKIKEFKTHGWKIMERIDDVVMIDADSAIDWITLALLSTFEHGVEEGVNRGIVEALNRMPSFYYKVDEGYMKKDAERILELLQATINSKRGV